MLLSTDTNLSSVYVPDRSLSEWRDIIMITTIYILYCLMIILLYYFWLRIATKHLMRNQAFQQMLSKFLKSIYAECALLLIKMISVWKMVPLYFTHTKKYRWSKYIVTQITGASILKLCKLNICIIYRRFTAFFHSYCIYVIINISFKSNGRLSDLL